MPRAGETENEQYRRVRGKFATPPSNEKMAKAIASDERQIAREAPGGKAESGKKPVSSQTQKVVDTVKSQAGNAANIPTKPINIEGMAKQVAANKEKYGASVTETQLQEGLTKTQKAYLATKKASIQRIVNPTS